MGLPAVKMNPENVVEERIARVEAHVENIQAAIVRVEAKTDRLDAKIDGVEKRLDAKIDAVKDSIASAKTWALGLYIGLLAAIGGCFMWIVQRLSELN